MYTHTQHERWHKLANVAKISMNDCNHQLTMEAEQGLHTLAAI
jgi:hypothetical protein